MQLPTEIIPLGPKQKKPPRLVVVFFLIIAASAVGYWVWNSYASPDARAERETSRRVDAWLVWEEEYKTAMREDTYGGTTPEETLALFVEALRNGDVELASKYFLIDTQNSQEKWREGLKTLQEEGKVGELIEIIQRAESYQQDRTRQSDYKLVTKRSNGDMESYINMELNEYSKVWKIESL